MYRPVIGLGGLPSQTTVFLLCLPENGKPRGYLTEKRSLLRLTIDRKCPNDVSLSAEPSRFFAA